MRTAVATESREEHLSAQLTVMSLRSKHQQLVLATRTSIRMISCDASDHRSPFQFDEFEAQWEEIGRLRVRGVSSRFCLNLTQNLAGGLSCTEAQQSHPCSHERTLHV